MSDAELEAAYRRLRIELVLEQAARPVPRDHISPAQAERNWAVLDAAISKPRRYEPEEET